MRRPRGEDDVNFKTITALALAAGLALFSLCGEAKAQDPYADYNRARAYHLFLTSRSPYRTYSGATPGYMRRYSTPYAYGEDWQAPTYHHERITPYGYERYVAPPARGGYVAPRPVVVVP